MMPNGIGVEEYLISRDGTAIGSTASTSWVDRTIQPNTSYTYTISPRDGNMNVGPGSSFTLTTPVAGTVNPRRIGVRPTGAYWGAGGEQVDLQSGNLNVTVPLVKPIGRGGVSVPVNLTYNSQLWRQDANGTWNLGADVGFGYGWRLLVSSVTPVYKGLWTIDHYVYTDSTGAEYRLDTLQNGLWRSSEGVYVRYDDTKNWLILPDGNFLEMDVVSQGAEWDAGTRYPSRAFDTSGNYILFQYAQGRLAPDVNTSSRLVGVQDPRSSCSHYVNSLLVPEPTYTLHYDSALAPHLLSVTSCIPTAETYTLQYTQAPSLTPPFGSPADFGAASFLTTVGNSVTGMANYFGYDPSNSGELSQMTMPYGGQVQWSYASFTNSSAMTHREVSSRSLKTVLDGQTSSVTFAPGSGDSALQLHAQRQVLDSESGALRSYSFQSDTTSFYAGLQTGEQDWDNAQSRQYRGIAYTWAQDPWGHPYVSESNTTLDPGSSSVTGKTKQALAADQTGPYGQIVSQSQYGYDSPATVRTYNYTYTAITGGLTPLWRLASTSLTAGGSPQTLSTNCYTASYSAVPGAAPRMHDSTLFGGFAQGEAQVPRGLVTWRTSTVGDLRTVSTAYDITGNVTKSTMGDGSTVSYTTDSTSGRYMAPAAVTPNGNSNVASSFTWATFLGLSQETAPNGATLTIGYDSAARPSQTTTPDGATTNYGYNNATIDSYGTWTASATNVSSINGRWTITTLDGLGRTVQTDMGTGTASTANSISRVRTIYGACACTPLGKVRQVSRPYNPNNGETPVYTTYTYDPLGRTTSVTLPDGVSTTTYAYSGNTVTVTDPGGRWKKYTSDAFGNVTQVNEPNPSGGADYVTSYAYNQFNKLTTVTMPRTMPGGNVVTQTRTFTYDTAQRLVSVTHPESGTTVYTYDTAGRVLTKKDAKNNKVAYTYDLYGRLTNIARTPGTGTVEPELTTTFAYDTTDSVSYATSVYGQLSYRTFSPVNTWGRLAKITHSGLAVERFQYTPSGRVKGKSLAMVTSGVQGSPFVGFFSYDGEGRMIEFRPDGLFKGTETYMNVGYRRWSYDTLGRPAGLTSYDHSDFATPVVQGATYNSAGQLASYARLAQSDYNMDGSLNDRALFDTVGFEYNALGQLIKQSSPPLAPGGRTWVPTIQYGYSGSPDPNQPTPNDGRIRSRIDTYPSSVYTPNGPSATIAYAYDTLGRLTSATSASSTAVLAWGQSFVYDPFGNLLQQNVTSGNAPAMNLTVDPNTNRVTTSGFSYDAAGNLTASPGASGPNAFSYDSENRLSVANGLNFRYGSSGERLFDGANWHFYAPDGTHLGKLTQNTTGASNWYDFSVELHFAGRLVWQNRFPVMTDRLGSVVQMSLRDRVNSYAYYPQGQWIANMPVPDQSIPGCWPNCGGGGDSVMDVAFGTYHRDGYWSNITGSFVTRGLDYAQNRFYDPARGRFTTADSTMDGAINDPVSWNKYAYAGGDLINKYDPQGTCYLWIGNPGSLEDPPDMCFPVGGNGPYKPPRMSPLDPPKVPCIQPAHPGLSDDQIQKMIDQAHVMLDAAKMGQEGGMPGFLGNMIGSFFLGGPWDFKDASGVVQGSSTQKQLRIFGNFAFGAVMEGLGFNLYQTKSIAGTAQVAICIAKGGADGSCGAGIPFVKPPYGDQPADQMDIEKGFKYETAVQGDNCAGKKP